VEALHGKHVRRIAKPALEERQERLVGRRVSGHLHLSPERLEINPRIGNAPEESS
jgi:hypothetical protein